MGLVWTVIKLLHKNHTQQHEEMKAENFSRVDIGQAKVYLSGRLRLVVPWRRMSVKYTISNQFHGGKESHG